MEENTEIQTNLEKIKDPITIAEIQVRNLETLLALITNKPYVGFLLNSFPIYSNNKFGLTPPREEKLTYIGVVERGGNKFLTELPSTLGGLDMVFKSNKTNAIFRKPITSPDMDVVKQLVESIEIERLQENFSVSFSNLNDTKRVFGLAKKKMEFAESKISEYEISFADEVYILNNNPSYIMSTSLPGIKSKHDDSGNVKFCIRDLSFTPLINLKGYNLPKDRSVKKGSKVSFIYKGVKESGVVMNISDNNQRYQDKKGRTINSKLYFIELNGELIRLRKRDFKLV